MSQSGKKTFIQRAKTSIFVVLFFVVFFVLSLFSSPTINIVPLFNEKSWKWIPAIFYILTFLSSVWLNYFFISELQKGILKHSTKSSSIWCGNFFVVIQSAAMIPCFLTTYFGFDGNKFMFIIFLIILFSGIACVFSIFWAMARWKYNISFKKSMQYASMAAFVLMFMIFTYFLLMTKAWTTVLALALIAMMTDVFSYLGGSKFGKTKMTTISPKKTWEGFLFGMSAAIIVAFILFGLFCLDDHFKLNSMHGFMGWQFSKHSDKKFAATWWWWIALIPFVSILSFLSLSGDLMFSKVKRANGIKDFGDSLKGHGGFLDRVDSISMVVVVYFIFSAIVSISVGGNNLDNSWIIHTI